jgi:hypothetical protein
MSKIRVGNKQNSILNGEWAGHVRGWWKKHTSGKRRAKQKKYIREELKTTRYCSEGLGKETYEND